MSLQAENVCVCMFYQLPVPAPLPLQHTQWFEFDIQQIFNKYV